MPTKLPETSGAVSPIKLPRYAPPLLLLFYAALAAVAVRYEGLHHDAQAYVLQALAVLDPSVFGQDLFLKFGSQDRYTLFSNFTALWIDAAGIDHGAAMVTALSLVLFHVALWVVVRALAGSPFAWIAVGLTMVLPGWYGAGEVFRVAERFLSARLPAEALCLLGIAAVLYKRRLLAGISFGLAAITHPLMTIPAVCIALGAWSIERWPGIKLIPAAVGLLASVMLVGVALGAGDALLQGDWLAATRSRSDFLFIDQWRISDWRHVVVVLATLACGVLMLPDGPVHRVLLPALAVAIVGIAATTAVSWGPPIKWVIQAQTWRWIWPGTVLAIGLLPLIAASAFRKETTGNRCAVLVLIAAWTLLTADRSSGSLHWVCIVLASLAVVMAMMWDRLSAESRTRSNRAAWLVVGAAGLWLTSMIATEIELEFLLGEDPSWIEKPIAVLKIPAAAAGLVVAVWYALTRTRQLIYPAAVLALACTILLGAGPRAWQTWSAEVFGARTQERFAEWRRIIEPDAEVFWPDQLQATWFALGRRSYLSMSQLGGLVFSRETAMEGRRRAASLEGLIPPGYWFNEPMTIDPADWAASLGDIRSACSVTDIDYVVHQTDFGTDLPAVEWPMPGRHVHLYDCKRLGKVPATRQ